MNGRYAVIPVMRTDEGYTISDMTLEYIWEKIVEEKKDTTVFYNGAIANIGEFVAFMRREDVYPIVVYDVDDKMFTGIAWINNLNEGTAQAHFCTFNNGEPILMGHEVLNYWEQFPKDLLGVVVGIIPNTNEKAIRFAKQIGFTVIGEIPNYCNTVYLDSRTPGVVMYKELGG